MSGSYYNEFDPYAAAWLRNLIAAGHLPAGDVDERSIVDVAPSDLAVHGGVAGVDCRAAPDSAVGGCLGAGSGFPYL